MAMGWPAPSTAALFAKADVVFVNGLHLEEPTRKMAAANQKSGSEIVNLGEQTLMGQPVTLTRTPSTLARAAPRRGEHTEEILAEIGYDPEELKRLKSQGVF